MAGEDVRTRILQGAQKLFQEKGLGKISMEDVAGSIGKGKSTLYYYFKSKEEIFSAVIDMEISGLITETIRQMNAAGSFPEKLLTFAMVKFEMGRKRKSLYTTMESLMGHEEALQYYQIKKSMHVHYVQKEKIVLLPVFMAAMSGKLIRQMNDAELNRCIEVYLSGLRGIIREVMVHGQPQDIQEYLPAYCDVFAKGLV